MGEKPGGAVGRREDRGDVPRSPRRHGVAQGAAGSARHPLLHRVRPHQQGDRPHVIITRTKCMYWRVSDFLFSFITISRLFPSFSRPTCAGKSASSARSRSGKTKKKKKKKNLCSSSGACVGSDGDETEGNGGGGEGIVCSRHEETPEGIVTVLAVPRHGPGKRGRELGGLPHQGGEARREQTLSFRGWAQVWSTGQVQAKGKITYLPT